jgi:hypothetical protein
VSSKAERAERRVSTHKPTRSTEAEKKSRKRMTPETTTPTPPQKKPSVTTVDEVADVETEAEKEADVEVAETVVDANVELADANETQDDDNGATRSDREEGKQQKREINPVPDSIAKEVAENIFKRTGVKYSWKKDIKIVCEEFVKELVKQITTGDKKRVQLTKYMSFKLTEREGQVFKPPKKDKNNAEEKEPRFTQLPPRYSISMFIANELSANLTKQYAEEHKEEVEAWNTLWNQMAEKDETKTSPEVFTELRKIVKANNQAKKKIAKDRKATKETM